VSEGHDFLQRGSVLSQIRRRRQIHILGLHFWTDAKEDPFQLQLDY